MTTSTKTARKGDKGHHVAQIQQILINEGFLTATAKSGTTNADGIFGTATKKSVLYFQQTHIGKDGQFLDDDGIVGKGTWWALRNPNGDAQRSGLEGKIPEGLSQARNDMLMVALGEWQKNVREIPNGSNRHERIDIYSNLVGKASSVKGPPWCAWFTSWVAQESNQGEYLLGKKLGSAWKHYKAAKKLHLWCDKKDGGPVPGDIFVMLYRDENGKLTFRGHVGFVLRVSEDGKTINTIEGNAGNRVKVGKRNVSQKNLVGWVRADSNLGGWTSGLVGAKSTDSDGTR